MKKPIDLEAISKSVYLTSDEAAALLRFPSKAAFMKFVYRHGLPKCHAGRRVLFRRRDLDDAVNPQSKRFARLNAGGDQHRDKPEEE